MNKTFTYRTASLAAAALLTLAVFTGTSALAGHEYRAAMIAQAQAPDAVVAVAVQHVTVIGHRSGHA